MCNSLQDTLAEVFIWNNNPQILSNEDFAEAQCPNHMLRIYNSPQNIYFHARFLACTQARTAYCFIQDDDYFVQPSIIRALMARIAEVHSTSVHLLPSHEMLYSFSSIIQVYPNIHTLFAWLGYGSMVKRAHVRDFLDLLEAISAHEEILKMADNYFTVLSNRLPELWFDQNHELGGGSPFTVGLVGEERNNRHIIHAGRILDSLTSEYHRGWEQYYPYVSMSTPPSPKEQGITRAACSGFTCVMETNIKLQAESLNNSVSSASEIVAHVTNQFAKFGKNAMQRYIECSPSFAVDGDANTSFCSPSATEGDWIALDWMIPGPAGDGLEFALLVDKLTEEILRNSKLEVSADGVTWNILAGALNCIYAEDGKARECSVAIGDHFLRKVRVYLERDISRGWTIHDIWLRSISY